MTEYIERETAIESLPVAWDSAINALRNVPAADVAPVVHCKDCAHRTEMGNCGHPRYHGILPTAYPYDFCSYGCPRGGDDDAKAD